MFDSVASIPRAEFPACGNKNKIENIGKAFGAVFDEARRGVRRSFKIVGQQNFDRLMDQRNDGEIATNFDTLSIGLNSRRDTHRFRGSFENFPCLEMDLWR